MTDQRSASRSKGHWFQTCLVSASVRFMYLWYDMFRRNSSEIFLQKTNIFNLGHIFRFLNKGYSNLGHVYKMRKKYCGKNY